MPNSGFLAPAEVAKACVQVGEDKAGLPIGKMFLLAILAGVYIGFGAHLAGPRLAASGRRRRSLALAIRALGRGVGLRLL